ncbi:MAG: hypothetical protein U1F37_20630 [Alphaproteobacteria bacterium]
MKRWLIPILLLLAPQAAAQAPAPAEMAAALQNLRAGRDADALYWLDRALGERSLAGAARADALEWRAFLHARRGNLRAARADFDGAIAADTDNPLRHRARARLHLRTGDFRAALADLEPAVARLGTDVGAETYADPREAQLGLAGAPRRPGTAAARSRSTEYARPKQLLRRAQIR